MFQAILLYAMFASIFTLQKDALNYAAPIFLTGSRMLFAGLCLLAFAVFWQKQRFVFSWTLVRVQALYALICIYLTNVFEISGLVLMPSSLSCLFYSFSPFLTALIAFFVLGEKLSRRQLLGLVIGFAGIIPIISIDLKLEPTFWLFNAADFYAIGAVICSVAGWIILKKAIFELDLSPVAVNGAGMTLGGLFTLANSYVSSEAWTPVPIHYLNKFILYSLAICIISNFICYNLYGRLLKKHSTTFMSFVGLVTPLFAVVYDKIFLGQVISWHFYVALFMFSLGLTVFHGKYQTS